MEEVTSPTSSQQLNAFFNKTPRYFEEDKIEQQSSIMVGSTEEGSGSILFSEPFQQNKQLEEEELHQLVVLDKQPTTVHRWRGILAAFFFSTLAHSSASIALVLFRYLQRIHHLPPSDDSTLLTPLPPLSMLLFLNLLAIVVYIPRMVYRLAQSFRTFAKQEEQEEIGTRKIFVSWISEVVLRDNLSQWMTSWFSYGLVFTALFRSILFLFAVKFTYASFISVALLGSPFIFLTLVLLGNRDLTHQLKTKSGYRVFLFFFAYTGYAIGTFFFLIGQTSDANNFVDLNSFAKHFYWFDLLGLLFASIGGIFLALQMFLHLKQRCNATTTVSMDKETWFIAQKCMLVAVLLLPSLLLENYWIPFFGTLFSSARHVISYLSLFLIHEVLGTWARIQAMKFVDNNVYIGTSSIHLLVTLLSANWILHEPISNFLIFVGVICNCAMLLWLSISFYKPIVKHFGKMEDETTTTHTSSVQNYQEILSHENLEEELPQTMMHASPLLNGLSNDTNYNNSNHSNSTLQNKAMKRHPSSAAIDLFSLGGVSNSSSAKVNDNSPSFLRAEQII